ncbi:histone-like nucleoid-structuring protein Lsr2 [Nocardia sp. CDC160]|uniref:histone-like nucleoid-structuring protein Lsr2 n=1 Tax=Nocardia sp. CDC160 TaxID=3112166 RepID=UPI002DBAD1D0|nr:Lsr2 family protein [Nocardia sp. CDC160]MEC3919278.1 Lsr2 family protein [Nocardia sp. CDC160]
MARKVVVELVDDFDGKSTAEETVLFAVDGVAYEIDLSTHNAARIRETFEPWTQRARRVGRTPRSTATNRTVGSKARTAVDREQTQAIRNWARKNGFEVSSRGRVSTEILAAYHKAGV